MGNLRWLLASCALICACPSDDAAAHRSPCEGHAAWEKRCNQEPPYWGETECLEIDWQDARPAFLDGMVDCFDTLACDQIDDTCEAAGFKAIGIADEADVKDDTLFQSCLQRTKTCAVNDDYCAAAVAYTDEGRKLVAGCLELDCSMLEACLRNPRR